jgi:hypothetical protein
MSAMPDGAIARTWRGVAATVRARPLAVVTIALLVFALHVMLPPLVLSVVRTPWTFFTFNPWLKRLPEYLASAAPLEQKVDFLSRVALFWFSADGPYGAPEWGFAVDTPDVVRFAAMSVLVALYFALWLRARDLLEPSMAPGGAPAKPWRPSNSANRTGGVVGALVSVLGLSTGPCSVVGCGAPVLPVVALAFAGLSSGTVALFSSLSRAAGAIVLLGLLAGVLYLAWRVAPRPASRPATPLRFEPTA